MLTVKLTFDAPDRHQMPALNAATPQTAQREPHFSAREASCTPDSCSSLELAMPLLKLDGSSRLADNSVAPKAARPAAPLNDVRNRAAETKI